VRGPLTGILDFAVMFSPKPHPDLHFESVGEVTYRMISTETARLAEVGRKASSSPISRPLSRRCTAR
jgi:hypothetical protein